MIRQDPVLSQVKLIAEPWDLGEGGYQVGNFPLGWAEWNDRYRDAMRAYWKGDGGVLGEFARRLTGSSDLYGASGRAPAREHQLRHRARRLHAARPGLATTRSTTRPTARTTATAHDNNLSWNCGVEGPTDDPRDRARCASARSATCSPRCCSRRACRCCSRATRSAARSAATTTPIARTTRSPGSTGTSTTPSGALLEFVAPLIALRRAHPVFRRRDFFQGAPLRGGGRQGHRVAASPTAAR